MGAVDDPDAYLAVCEGLRDGRGTQMSSRIHRRLLACCWVGGSLSEPAGEAGTSGSAARVTRDCFRDRQGCPRHG